MMHISPRMYSSDGSLEGMSGVDERGEPPSLSPKQGQGKSSKQDKVDFFARLLEGLVKNSPTGRGLTLSVLGEGPQPEAAQAGGEPQGNASKKNQHKKARVSGGETREGGRSRSGEGAQGRILRGRNNQDPGGSFSLLLVQEGPVPDQAGPQVLLQQKDRLPLLRRQTDKPRLASAAGSRTETGAGDPQVQTETAGKDTGSPGSISTLKVHNRHIQDSTDVEKAGASKAGLFRASQSPDTHLKPSPDPRPVMEAGEEPARKGLKKDADVKARDKRRDRTDLRDLRSQERADSVSGSLVPGETKSAGETKTLELTVDLHTETPDREALPASRDSPLTGSFEDLLARELSQNLNGDIVRQAQVVLRDGGAGTIRLALKPESLGNVKIQLELAEKKITGHIIVESNEALRAFEREIHSLEQAFKDSGFGETSLDTALASGRDGQGGNPRQRDPSGPFFSERFALSTYNTASEGEAGFIAAGNVSGHIPIDMLV
ncbi:MAG: flagellar hook-length control protein FliK [Treponema sp.]|nr:flagellar hook-length control protein FliK [Treponema sp.]